MKLLSRSLYAVLFLLLSFCAIAQEKGKIEFSVKDYDFGEIKEVDGPVTYEFEFTNTGQAPIVISRVKASCGCTTPGWSKEPVLPGEKGFVKAQYNPRNRPGGFRKSLTITSNGEQPMTQVYIRGNVIPRVKTIDELLRYNIGLVRFKNRSLNMGRITTEKVLDRSFEVYNQSDSVSVTFSDKYEGPDFIKVSYEPQTLGPKEKGQMILSYDPNHPDNLGYNNHGIVIGTDEGNDSDKKLNILATITEYFPPMTPEELEQAPKLGITDRLQDLGAVNQGDKVETTFVLTNIGKSDLNIRQVKSNCSCLVASLPTNDLKPGETTELKLVFDSSRRRGNQTKSVTIYSNDPKSPNQIATVKTSVKTGN